MSLEKQKQKNHTERNKRTEWDGVEGGGGGSRREFFVKESK